MHWVITSARLWAVPIFLMVFREWSEKIRARERWPVYILCPTLNGLQENIGTAHSLDFSPLFSVFIWLSGNAVKILLPYFAKYSQHQLFTSQWWKKESVLFDKRNVKQFVKSHVKFCHTKIMNLNVYKSIMSYAKKINKISGWIFGSCLILHFSFQQVNYHRCLFDYR